MGKTLKSIYDKLSTGSKRRINNRYKELLLEEVKILSRSKSRKSKALLKKTKVALAQL